MIEIPRQTVDTEPERIILKDDHDSVELRQLTVEDARAYFELIESDRAHLSQFGDQTAEKYQTVEDVEASVIDPVGEQYRFGVWDEGHMVGFMKLKRNDEGDLETGSWVAKKHTGNKYAARARRLVTQYAFTVLGAPRIVSKIHVGNIASRKSVESNGYRLADEVDGEWIMVLDNPELQGSDAA